MDPKLSAAIKSAFSVWLNAAMAEVKRHPEHKAELKKAMDGDGDVRIVFHVRGNCISLETIDYAENAITELLREQLVPGDLPSETKH